MLYVKYRWEIWKRWWQHVLLRTNNNNMTFDFTWLVLTGFFCTISKQVKVFMSNLIFKGLKTPSEGRSGRFQSTCLWTERRPLCPPVNVSAHTDPPRFQKPAAYSHVVTPSTDLILALLLLLLMMFGLTVWGATAAICGDLLWSHALHALPFLLLVWCVRGVRLQPMYSVFKQKPAGYIKYTRRWTI